MGKACPHGRDSCERKHAHSGDAAVSGTIWGSQEHGLHFDTSVQLFEQVRLDDRGMPCGGVAEHSDTGECRVVALPNTVTRPFLIVCLHILTTLYLFSSLTQAFSLAVHDAGLRVAYLPYETARHVGTDEEGFGSAYELNNMDRDWYRGGEWSSGQ